MKKWSLAALAERQLAQARTAPGRRSSYIIHSGHELTFRQAVIAVIGGQTLVEHDNPGGATLHVLKGRSN